MDASTTPLISELVTPTLPFESNLSWGQREQTATVLYSQGIRELEGKQNMINYRPSFGWFSTTHEKEAGSGRRYEIGPDSEENDKANKDRMYIKLKRDRMIQRENKEEDFRRLSHQSHQYFRFCR